MRHFLVGLFVAVATSHSANASYEITPMRVSIEPQGPKSTVTYTVRNMGDNKIPVQISIVHREPDLNGKETYKETPDIDDLFQIYPAQLVLGPQETRSIRVSWIGDPKITREQAFRLIGEELPFQVDRPIKSNKKQVGIIALSLKYVAALYVAPPGVSSRLVVTKAEPSSADPNKMEIQVENTGGKHQLIKTPTLKIQAGNAPPVLLSKAQLPELVGQNILSGKTRLFTIPWPGGVAKGAPLKIEITTDAE